MSDIYGPPLSFRAIYRADGSVIAEGFGLSDAAWWVSEKRCEIVQSTGLNDAAGVEIYGGDVFISDIPPSGPGWQYGFIGFESGKFAAIYTEGITDFDCLICLEPLGLHVGESLRVIGNRWQPREALEARAWEVVSGKPH